MSNASITTVVGLVAVTTTVVEDIVVEVTVSSTEALHPIVGPTTVIAIIAPLGKRTVKTMVIVKITLPIVAPKTVANAIPVITVITSVKADVTAIVGKRPSFIAKINKTVKSMGCALTHGSNAARILPTRRNHLAVAPKQAIIRMMILALKLVQAAAVCYRTKVTKAAAGAAAVQALTTITLAYPIVIVMPPLIMTTLEGTCTRIKPQLLLRNLQKRNLP